jgi:sorbitol-6-phosphate 2-dehydrogenase
VNNAVDTITLRLRRWAPLLRGLLADGGRLPAVRFEEVGQETALDDASTLNLDPAPFEDAEREANDGSLCDRLRKTLRIHGARPRAITVPGLGVFRVDDSTAAHGRLAGKLALVTGAAQGFGLEIATGLAAEGARVALADLNAEGARAAADRLSDRHGDGRAVPLTLDVANADSVQAAIDALLRVWGGLDLLVSNAGVLRAGGVEDFTERDFDFVTTVNYKGYFLCVRAASPVLARQHLACPDVWSDIVQINSKSGLEGSRRNFAYAGGKFGGIGLTQSFALELVESGVKVNAICPGNFFDGPLWSDPDTGLFVQYLKAGKVPGAKTVEDVRHFYEAKAPMKRGCAGPDVLRAIVYVVEQQYETGQAVPVTGGQVMLS